MKKFLIMLGMILALAVPSTAFANEDDPGGNSEWCNSGRYGAVIYTLAPYQTQWHYYVCDYWWETNAGTVLYGYCSTCTNQHYWGHYVGYYHPVVFGDLWVIT